MIWQHRQILKYLDLDSILVTLGEHGMRLFEKNGRITHIPTVAQEVFDVSGAGDTVIATFTLALSCGATKLEAAHIANFAAGIVVGKLGTAVTTRKELLERLKYKMDVIGVIPARYSSTRFEGKVLADILGKPMIQHVWETGKAGLAFG